MIIDLTSVHRSKIPLRTLFHHVQNSLLYRRA